MKAHIAAHNGKILSKKEEISEGCNFRENGDPCHHQGEQPNKQNWGTFKKQYRGHKFDFKHKDKYGTTLSRHIWRLRDMNVKYSIKWEIKEKAPIYKPGAKECKLCNAEKYHILMEDYKQSLNCRSELLLNPSGN